MSKRIFRSFKSTPRKPAGAERPGQAAKAARRAAEAGRAESSSAEEAEFRDVYDHLVAAGAVPWVIFLLDAMRLAAIADLSRRPDWRTLPEDEQKLAIHHRTREIQREVTTELHQNSTLTERAQNAADLRKTLGVLAVEMPYLLSKNYDDQATFEKRAGVFLEWAKKRHPGHAAFSLKVVNPS